jgi:tRNA(Ile)-lysidine synthase
MMSGFTISRLAASLTLLVPDPRTARFCVAFSGGVDSSVLLHSMAALRAQWPGMSARALHVNHHLQPQADNWARHCIEFASGAAVDCRVLDVSVAPARGESMEAAARHARYSSLSGALGAGEYLLTAHHRDDQLETVLLQLLRGAGVAGLSGMPARTTLGRGHQLRPLLDVAHAELVAYAIGAGLHWIEDVSNIDTRFDRNFLRQQLLPVLYARWPAAAETVARSARHLAEAQSLLTERAREDLAAARAGANLRIATLRALAPARARNLLRFWIDTAGFRVPPSAVLDQILSQMLLARADAMPAVTWGDTEMRRYRDELYLGVAPPQTPTTELHWDWRSCSELDLPIPLGRLRLRAARLGECALAPPALAVRVGFQCGSQRLRLAPHAPSRTLRNLFQEHGVVPWMRACLPLLFVGNTLAAVADLWIDAEFQAREPGGMAIDWLDHPAIF